MKFLRFLTPVLLASTLPAQNFNIQFGGDFPLPSSSYGAAANQPGVWNGLWTSPPQTTSLVDLGGATSSVSVTNLDEFFEIAFDNPGTTGQDEVLLDYLAYPVLSSGGRLRVDGLQAGDYELFTYAWAPDSAAYVSGVEVLGSIDPLENVGGAWPGALTRGITHAVHRVSVAPGASVTVRITAVAQYGSLNGLQIVRKEPGTPFCAGDGSGTPCPCGNNSTPGANEGCLNALGLAGRLRASGTASISGDTLVLRGSEMPDSSCLYFQGTTDSGGGAGTPFGDGLRCAGGTLVRLGTKLNQGGASQYPEAADPDVSVIGLVVSGGETRTYQAWYRNSATFCTDSTFNLTNGVSVTWSL